MPKVEAAEVFSIAGEPGDYVPLSDLDRANAEIERVTKQRDGLAISLYCWTRQFASKEAAIDILEEHGLDYEGDGTVTEIGNG